MFPTNIVVIDSIAIRYVEKNQNKHKKNIFNRWILILIYIFNTKNKFEKTLL